MFLPTNIAIIITGVDPFPYLSKMDRYERDEYIWTKVANCQLWINMVRWCALPNLDEAEGVNDPPRLRVWVDSTDSRWNRRSRSSMSTNQWKKDWIRRACTQWEASKDYNEN